MDPARLCDSSFSPTVRHRSSTRRPTSTSGVRPMANGGLLRGRRVGSVGRARPARRERSPAGIWQAIGVAPGAALQSPRSMKPKSPGRRVGPEHDHPLGAEGSSAPCIPGTNCPERPGGKRQVVTRTADRLAVASRAGPGRGPRSRVPARLNKTHRRGGPDPKQYLPL